MDIGLKYDDIAPFWTEQHFDSDYGVPQFERALSYATSSGKALDVGCGSGGRFIKRLETRGFEVTGIDASIKMIKRARTHHPDAVFHHSEIQQWKAVDTFDFILAWDSLFHLPLRDQKPVLAKLCSLLNSGGVLMHSFGDAIGCHVDHWRGHEFEYSSIGISENLNILMGYGLEPVHLERDQYPENHVYSIAVKTPE